MASLPGLRMSIPPLKNDAVLDRDARCDHVAGQRAFAADVHAIARLAVAAHLAEHDDLACHDVRCDLAVAAHGHTVAGQG